MTTFECGITPLLKASWDQSLKVFYIQSEVFVVSTGIILIFQFWSIWDFNDFWESFNPGNLLSELHLRLSFCFCGWPCVDEDDEKQAQEWRDCEQLLAGTLMWPMNRDSSRAGSHPREQALVRWSLDNMAVTWTRPRRRPCKGEDPLHGAHASSDKAFRQVLDSTLALEGHTG